MGIRYVAVAGAAAVDAAEVAGAGAVVVRREEGDQERGSPDWMRSNPDRQPVPTAAATH